LILNGPSDLYLIGFYSKRFTVRFEVLTVVYGIVYLDWVKRRLKVVIVVLLQHILCVLGVYLAQVSIMVLLPTRRNIRMPLVLLGHLSWLLVLREKLRFSI
jgi:hypothetical protein